MVTVPKADVDAGAEMTYEVALGGGMAGHTHQITVTATDFTTLKDMGTVTVTSTTGGNNNHTHDVTLVCSA